MGVLKIIGIVIGIIIGVISCFLGIVDIGKFLHNRYAYVTVLGTAKYKTEETAKPNLALSAIIRIGEELDKTDDKGSFKISKIKKGEKKLFIITLREDHKFIYAESRIDIERKSFWKSLLDPKVEIGEIIFKPSTIHVAQKPKIRLSGKVTYMEVDQEKKCVPGATLYIAKEQPIRTTDWDGNYSIEFSPGDYHLLVVGPEKKSFHAIDISDESSDKTINIDNFPRNFGAVRGVVKERSGRPAQWVSVSLDNKYFDVTGYNGKYFIDNVPFNKKYETYTLTARRGINEIPFYSYVRIDSHKAVRQDIKEFPVKSGIASQIKYLHGTKAVPAGMAEEFPPTVGKLYAWTDEQYYGEEVTHMWHYGNNIFATKPALKAFSEVEILPNQVGNWRVDVLNKSGVIVDSMDFKVEKPN